MLTNMGFNMAERNVRAGIRPRPTCTAEATLAWRGPIRTPTARGLRPRYGRGIQAQAADAQASSSKQLRNAAWWPPPVLHSPWPTLWRIV